MLMDDPETLATLLGFSIVLFAFFFSFSFSLSKKESSNFALLRYKHVTPEVEVMDLNRDSKLKHSNMNDILTSQTATLNKEICNLHMLHIAT